MGRAGAGAGAGGSATTAEARLRARREMAEARAREDPSNAFWRGIECPMGHGPQVGGSGTDDDGAPLRPLTTFADSEHRAHIIPKIKAGYSQQAIDFEERWGDNEAEQDELSMEDLKKLIGYLVAMAVMTLVFTQLNPHGSAV